MLCTTTRRRFSCSSFSLFLGIAVLLKLTTHNSTSSERWEGGLVFFNDSVRPLVWTSTGPIFTQFAGLVELWLYMNDPSRDVAVATNFVGKIDLQSTHLTWLSSRAIREISACREKVCECNCCMLLRRRQTNYLIRWTHANQLTEHLTIIYWRRGG